jgi:acyl transferase domain-containing protein/NADPH:quinone reductase-like Zn-dependent oxidoreductase/acyl carrier protein/SAM-dependent methyltransferase
MKQELIAIVGAACRLPGANNIDELWTLLSTGKDAVTEIPDERWSKDFYFHPDPAERGKSYTWAAGVIDNVDLFDAGFFGISPREADQIDPQQRLLLELTWQALEDAGIPAARIAGSGGGVYIGASSGDYGDIRMGDPSSGDAYFMTGVTASILANRVSYIYDLHGPSFTVDTACSSSLVALDQACKDIRAGRVPLAVVGGVSLLLSPYPFIGFCRASMLSPKGRCFAFDARASGYVRAEGAGVVILKPLEQAIADGDTVRGVIMGTGVNSDGRTVGLSLPNGSAQSALLEAVYRESGVAPDDLSFIEAHGTGTPAGDPIELDALGSAVARKRTAPLPVGSVKTNLGHLEAASGMAGLLKTMLSLEKRLIPPSLHFETPNPAIPFDTLNVQVVTQATPLSPAQQTLFAGVNSFGFGGTNAHAVLASPPSSIPQAEQDDPAPLPPLLISARSAVALKELAADWSHRIADVNERDAAKMLRASARRRDHHAHRMVVLGESAIEIADRLDSFSSIAHAPSLFTASALQSGKLAFVYSGNGVQYPGMGRAAMLHSRVFRETLAELDPIIAPLLGWSIRDRMMRDEDPAMLARTDIAQPMLFAVQIGITAALRDAGVAPSAFTGHSVGEIAASWAAGALSLAEASRVIVARSAQQQRTQGAGAMAVLGVDAERAAEFLPSVDHKLEIAAINSSKMVTVAGPSGAIDRLKVAAERKDWRFTRLDLDYAFHSAVLDPVRGDLIATLGSIDGSDCGQRFISTVTGEAADGRALDAEYWWRNVRDPVRFKAAIDHLVADGVRIFVEIGPNPALLSHIKDSLRSADIIGRTFGSLTRKDVYEDPFPSIAAECHTAGHDISNARIFDGTSDIRALPRYPWQRERHWFTPTDDGIFLDTPRRDHPLLGFQRNPPIAVWSNMLSTEAQPWLMDHAVEGVPVLPGAALVEMALAAAHVIHPTAQCLEVTGVEIARALTIEPGQTRATQVVFQDDGQLQISSRPRLGEEIWNIHAVGRIARGSVYRQAETADRPVAYSIGAATLYATAHRFGLDYGAHFRTVGRVDVIDDREVVVALDTATGATLGDEFIINPALFDGALQGCFALLGARVDIEAGESFIPSRFGRIRAYAPYFRQPAKASLVIRHAGMRAICATIALLAADGGGIADIDDCWFQRVRLNRQTAFASRVFRFDRVAAPNAMITDSPAIDAALPIDRSSQPGKDYQETRLLFGAFLASCAYAAITGLTPSPFRIADLILTGTVAQEAAAFLDWTLRLLERHGIACETGEGWSLSIESDLPDADSIWRTLVDDAPELSAELALAGALDIPKLLRKGFDNTILAPALIDHMLNASPSGQQALAALCDIVADMARRWPPGRQLRILEVGAGAGALTRRLLRQLGGWAGTLVYVATDPDPNMAQRLESLAGGSANLSADQWDITDGSAAPSRHAKQFDIIVSMYGLTRAELDSAAIARLKKALAPGGQLVAAEPDHNDLWNAVFGQTKDWWPSTHDSDIAMTPILGGAALSGLITEGGLSLRGQRRIDSGLWPVNLSIAQRETGTDTQPPAVILPADMRVILIAAESDPTAIELAERLSAAGATALILDPPRVADGAMLCAALADTGDIPPHIICLPPINGDASASAGGATARMVSILTVARLTAQTSTRACLWIVTKDAQRCGGSAQPISSEAALWGLGRTLANELPQLDPRLIDLSLQLDPTESADILTGEIAYADREREITWTQSGRHALRLRRGLPEKMSIPPSTALKIDYPGLMDTLRWEAVAEPKAGSGQVMIEVKAAGLNFRDVMWAMALLPEEALMGGFSGPTLGLECTGIVRQIGADVEGFTVGDRVMALAPAALRSHVVTEAHAVARLPDGLSFAAGATIPVAYLTVLYSLSTLARLEPGEWVLIHGGAGGVGLAAIQYAKHRGAIIVATAGSTVKRAFLRRLGVHHVLDSRDIAFADAVRDLTGGRGVDVVLNSLGGDAMERSLGLLRPFGRFIELGKRDFMMDTRVGLRVLRQNISYHAVDVDRLPVDRPELAASLLQTVTDLMESGALRPLPYRTFPFAEAAEAFRLMQGAGHLGKIVLVPDGHSIALPVLPAAFVRADISYVVTGGLTGFGLETARWLASRGARHLALLSRRPVAEIDGASDAVAAFRAEGIDARAFPCNVADASALEATLADIRRNMPAIGGVIHAAMVVEDGLTGNLTSEGIARVMRPKMDGALNLDRLTRHDPIDLFILYSSATTVMGAPGQGSYVAANMALESIALRRAAEGLPALAVAWGPIADVGYLAQQEAARDALMRRLATTPMTAVEALDSLPLLMASGLPVVAFAPVRWDAASQYLPIVKTPLFEDVVGGGVDMGSADLRDHIHTLSSAEAKEFITGLLVEEAARVMSFAPDRIDAQRPLSEFGMDSLMAVELRLALEARLGIDVPLVSLSDSTSLSTIATRMVRNLSKPETTDSLVETIMKHEANSPKPVQQERGMNG